MPPDKKRDAQAKRAAALRKRISQLKEDAPATEPRTPREFTDDAAREEWLRETGKNRSASKRRKHP